METACYGGDFLLTAGGIPKECTPKEAVLQQVYVRLAAKRGGLPYLPALGSRLHALPDRARTTEAVLACIAEAMEDCTDAEILSTTVEDGRITAEVMTPYGRGTVIVEKGGI